MRRQYLRLAAASLLVAAAPVTAQGGRADARLAARLDSVLKETVRTGPAPGVTILVARGPRILYAKGAGLADVSNAVPATPATVYGIGSITKQFAAALVLQLASEGRLSLDDAVTRFLPDQPMPAGRVTLRHLLTHTSGLSGDVPDSLRPRNFVRVDLAPGERIALGRHAPAAFLPGAAWQYGSYNYMLLAAVVERVTGRRFDDVLAERVARPLGLRSLRRCDPAAIIPRRATGYVRDSAGRLAPAPYASPTQSSGNAGLCADAPDLAAWAWALANGRVVPMAAYRDMTTAGRVNDGTAVDYGLGLMLGALGTHPRVYHTGVAGGFMAVLSHYPADSLTLVVLTNFQGDEHAVWYTEQRVARAALGLPEPVELPLDSLGAARLAGTYRGGGVEARVSVTRGRLTAQLSGTNRATFLVPHPLLNQADGTFLSSWDTSTRLRFTPTGAGTTLYVETPDGRHYALARDTR